MLLGQGHLGNQRLPSLFITLIAFVYCIRAVVGTGATEVMWSFVAIMVITAATFEDGIATVTSDASLCCIFVDWTSGGNDDASHSQAFALLQTIRRRNKSVPVLLMAEHSCVDTLTLDSMRLVNEFVWMHEDTAEFIAARVRSLIQRYYQQLLPVYFVPTRTTDFMVLCLFSIGVTKGKWGEKFASFEKELEGAELIDGVYHIWALKQ